MHAKRIKEICNQFCSIFHIVVINGKFYDINEKSKISDDWVKNKLVNYFEDTGPRDCDQIIETLKQLECDNTENFTVASVNGLTLIDPQAYDQRTVERLKATFGEMLNPMIEWCHNLNSGVCPKQALNIYGPSNFGKSYFIDNTFGKMFTTCQGDWRGDWTIQKATDNTQLIMFVDKDKGCIPSNKWEFIKQTHQGRTVCIEVNPKCGAKYEIHAALTSLIQTQLPARLYVDEYKKFNNSMYRLECEQEDIAFKNRMLFVEFKIDNREFDWHWDTIYSVFVKGELN